MRETPVGRNIFAKTSSSALRSIFFKPRHKRRSPRRLHNARSPSRLSRFGLPNHNDAANIKPRRAQRRKRKQRVIDRAKRRPRNQQHRQPQMPHQIGHQLRVVDRNERAARALRRSDSPCAANPRHLDLAQTRCALPPAAPPDAAKPAARIDRLPAAVRARGSPARRITVGGRCLRACRSGSASSRSRRAPRTASPRPPSCPRPYPFR